MRSKVAKWLFKTDLKDGFERRITGGFWNSDPNYPYKPHAGVDYGANIGEEVTAYDTFEVIGINTGHSDYGKHVFLYFPKIDKTGLYAHLDSIGVSPGQKGSAQEVIGKSGNTGKSGGPHLHFGFAKGKVTSTNKGSHEGDIWLNYETYSYTPIGKGTTEDGYIIVTDERGLNVRTAPSESSSIDRVLATGERYDYSAYVDENGIRWVTNGSTFVARKRLDDSEFFADAFFKNEAPSKPVSNVGKAWTPNSVPLTLYPNSTGGTNYGPSRTKRSYTVLAEANGRIQIQNQYFQSPENKVWVNLSDGKVG